MRAKLAELEPDMVTASDVVTGDGRLLMPRGTVLTARSIRLLKVWGVVEAQVERKLSLLRNETPGDVDPEILAKVRRDNEKRFMHTNMNHPAMIELEYLSTLRKTRAIQEGAPAAAAIEKVNVTPGDLEFSMPLPSINLSRLSEFGMRLPTLPAVFNRINETIMNPNSSAGDIADVVSKDSGLTYQLLGIVNSAFYGFISKIDTVSRAVAIVGTKQLTSLVFGITVMKIFNRIPAEHIDMQQFWRHSVACGIASRVIAGYKKIQNTERLFVAGLLHDIGRLLMYNLWPEHALRTLLVSRRDSRLLYQVEEELLDIDHAGIGALMAERWKLPFLLESTIHYHHSPALSHNLLESSIVHLADIIVHAMETGSSGDVFVPPLDSAAWEALDISENLLTFIVDHVDRQIDETISYFFDSREGN